MAAASEAATGMETPKAATYMAETSGMSDTHAVCETATPKMGDIYAAVGETATPVMGSTKAVIHAYNSYAAETHAVMVNGPVSAKAMIEAAVVRVPTIKDGGIAVIIPA